MKVDRSNARRRVVWALALMLALPAVPALATATTAPQLTDKRGDANFWAHAFYLLEPQPDPVPDPYEGSPDTRPVSIAGADLVEAWYETEYETVKDMEGGRIVRVRHVPTRLRVNVRTDGPPAPTFGPTVQTWILATAGECPLTFAFQFVGQASSTDEQRATVTPNQGCEVERGPHPMQVSGDVASFSVPLGGALAAGSELTSRDTARGGTGGFGGMASFAALPGGLRLIDQARLGTTFEIGSDVPPDVDCVATPSHEECSA